MSRRIAGSPRNLFLTNIVNSGIFFMMSTNMKVASEQFFFVGRLQAKKKTTFLGGVKTEQFALHETNIEIIFSVVSVVVFFFQ